ncbi:MAG TPA: HD domain-containing phosphohydrolase [Abditibacterium sp.]|jgi:putative two-component system response regulator
MNNEMPRAEMPRAEMPPLDSLRFDATRGFSSRAEALRVEAQRVEMLRDQSLRRSRILIADDEPANVLLLERMLSNAGYTNLHTAGNGREAVEACRAVPPDLILLDLMMPERDGFGVLEDLSDLCAEQFLPVLVLTADSNPEAKRRALSAGAKDFLIKPFDHVEVMLRVRNLLETRFLTLQLRDNNRNLETQILQRTAALRESNAQLEIFNTQLQISTRAVEESQMEVLQRLAQAAELRDDDTGQHTQRVGALAARLAQQLGLPENHVELIRRSAPLHDVGKIGISDTILLKPGRLTADEFEVMKKHTTIGGELLAGGHSPFVCAAESIALSHHERFDGSGYPNRLAGDAIPLEGRILAVVDVFDALTHERPYKAAWPINDARLEIEAQKGRHFDPEIVNAFLSLNL